MDVPVPPGPIDADGEATESSREELKLFFELVAEVVAEQGEPRPFILAEIANLEDEYLGPASPEAR
jgi:hypothetical protein